MQFFILNIIINYYSFINTNIQYTKFIYIYFKIYQNKIHKIPIYFNIYKNYKHSNLFIYNFYLLFYILIFIFLIIQFNHKSTNILNSFKHIYLQN
jgi:hypothetical protein